VAERLFVHQFDNGLVLLAEQLDHVVSTAVNLAIPAGASRDGPEMAGAGGVLTEWLFRGAGGRDSRGLNGELDALGCHHDEDVHSTFVQLACSQTYQNLKPVLKLYGDIVKLPTLAAETFEPCRNLAVQELASLEDEPARRCNLRLREKFYPVPLGSCPLGQERTLRWLTTETLRAHAKRHLTPHGTILAVAGRLEWEPLRDWVEECFGSWAGKALPAVEITDPLGGVTHEQKETSQVQIALAFSAPLTKDTHYYPMRVAEMVLSGGMSGRLFTEIREKRGLVYSVGARYQGVKVAAGMFVYAGTVPEHAQQTLEATVAELRRLGEGITTDELSRAKTQLKSALIMQGESTCARANGLVTDWHLLGRLRSLEEIAQAIEAVTHQQVNDCLAVYPAKELTAYFVGPDALECSCLG